MIRAETERSEAWRSAAWASALDLCAGTLGAIAYRSSTSMPSWPLVQFALVGGVAFAVLLAWRSMPRRLCLALLQLNFVSALLTSLSGAHAQVHGAPAGGPVLDLYQSVKAGLIVIGIISPSVLVGASWIVVFAAAPALQLLAFPAEIRAHVSEPGVWFVFVYAVIAVALLLYRRRSAALARALAAEHAERVAAERAARVALALRDLANTPLQTLKSSASLLRHDLEQPEVVLDAMDRAVSKLETLQQALTPFEQHVEWTEGGESFDAVAQIEALAKRPPKP